MENKEIRPTGSWNFRIIRKGRKSKDKKGEFFVRFWHPIHGRWCYISNGDIIAWEIYYDTRKEKKAIYKTVSERNSKKYYIKEVIHRNTRPVSNYDIDHFIELDNGTIIAISIIGKEWLEISEKEYKNESWEY